MPERNLRDITTKTKLVLPIGERTYHIPRVTGRVWLEFEDYQQKMEAGMLAGKPTAAIARELETKDIDLWARACGPEWDRMLDELDIDDITLAGNTAFLWQLGQPEAADLYWDTAGKGSAPTPQAPTPSKTPSAKSGDEATTTRKPTSGSGTTNRKPRKTAKRASPGRKSSATATS